MDLENQGMDEFEAAEAFGDLLGDDLLAPVMKPWMVKS